MAEQYPHNASQYEKLTETIGDLENTLRLKEERYNKYKHCVFTSDYARSDLKREVFLHKSLIDKTCGSFGVCLILKMYFKFIFKYSKFFTFIDYFYSRYLHIVLIFLGTI